MKRKIVLLVVTLFIVAAAAIFAGCSTSNPSTATGSPEVKKEVASSQANSQVTEIVVTAKDMMFEPKVITVEKGTKVKLTFKNQENNANNLVIQGTSIKTENVAPKKEQTIEFVADRQGEFKMMSTVSNMESMSAKFIVK